MDVFEKPIKRLGRRFGLDIARARPILSGLLVDRRIDCVFDVGANVGQFAREIRANGYGGRIVSFEPVDAPFRRCAEAAAKDPAWDVVQLALGAEAASSTINVSKQSVFSSIRKTSAYADNYYPDAATDHVETIVIETLDEVFPKYSGERNFLKIDTQGFEEQVLAGASGCLDKFLGVQLELPCEHLYQGTWSLGAGITFMERRGFFLAQCRTLNISREDPQRILEVDCVFARG